MGYGWLVPSEHRPGSIGSVGDGAAATDLHDRGGSGHLLTELQLAESPARLPDVCQGSGPRDRLDAGSVGVINDRLTGNQQLSGDCSLAASAAARWVRTSAGHDTVISRIGGAAET